MIVEPAGWEDRRSLLSHETIDTTRESNETRIDTHQWSWTSLVRDLREAPERSTLREKKQQGGKKTLTYYGCGKPGHFARDYRSKNIVQRPQLNVLEKVQSKDATEEAPVEDPPIWDEVEADIDN